MAFALLWLNHMDSAGNTTNLSHRPLYPVREADERLESEMAEAVVYFGFPFIPTPSGWVLADPRDSR